MGGGEAVKTYVKMPAPARALLDELSSTLSKKAFNFDLGTDALKSELEIRDTRKPYSEIRSAFDALGVEHRQYSGYISREPISKARAFSIMEQVARELPWFMKVAQRCDITSAPGGSYDFLIYSKEEETVMRNVDREMEEPPRERTRESPRRCDGVQYAELDEGESLDDYLSDLIRAHDLIAKANGRRTVEELYRDVNSPLGRDPARPAGR